MDIDKKSDNRPEPLYKAETHAIIGFAFAIINELGHGLNEKLYENALTVEFRQNRISFNQQANYPVLYKGTEIGRFIPDLVAYDRIIVDTKVIDPITDHERGQIINYLRITKLRVGLLLNFKHARLEYERIQL